MGLERERADELRECGPVLVDVDEDTVEAESPLLGGLRGQALLDSSLEVCLVWNLKLYHRLCNAIQQYESVVDSKWFRNRLVPVFLERNNGQLMPGRQLG